MADPGFPGGGGANSPGGVPTYNFAEFSQKLHEIERIWSPRKGARPKFYYVDPPLLWDCYLFGVILVWNIKTHIVDSQLSLTGPS